MSRRAQVEPLYSITEIIEKLATARQKRLPKTTYADQLRKLWLTDVANDRGDWRVQYVPNGKVWINLSKLRRAHPELFTVHNVTRGEFEELVEEMRTVKKTVIDLRKAKNSHGAAIRQLQLLFETNEHKRE